MGAMRTFLDDSELEKYAKVFPALTLPAVGTDAESALITLAKCAVENLKFLNTYSGIPLEVLYENIGQRQKASNVAALSMVRMSGNTGGEELGLLQIAGSAEKAAYESIFAPAMISDELWTAQENVIKRQNAYLKDIQTTYAEKRQDLPGFSMRDFTQSEVFKWLVDWALTLIPTDIDKVIYEAIQKHANKVIGWALIWLQKAYYAGSMLCAAMADENAYLLRMTKSPEAYDLRSRIISQHDRSIQSLLEQVALAESQSAQTMTADEERKLLMKEAFSERVFECPYSGLCLGEKNGVADVSEFEFETA